MIDVYGNCYHESEMIDGAPVVEPGNDTPAPPPRTCRNCGHPVDLHYCPRCGQHVRDHNTKLWHFVAEFLEEFVRFDSKFLRTIIPLILKPGYLTQEWVNGKRVRYITPLKVFFTLSAIAFLVISYKVNTGGQQTKNPVEINLSAKDEKADLKEVSPLAEMVRDIAESYSKVDQRLLLKEFLSHLPTASILMVPFAAMMFGALYLRRPKYYVEHLVFTLHFGAFSFLILTLAFLVPGDWVAPVAYCWVAGYLLVAMKRNYGQGWFKTTAKWLFFGFSYTILIALVLIITALVAARNARELTRDQTNPALPKSSKGEPKGTKSKAFPKTSGPSSPALQSAKKTSSLKEGLDDE